MPLFDYKVSLELQGGMPQRALLRLRREKIPLYNVVKTSSDTLRFRIWKKDEKKVFAIYPNVCYNIGAYTPYTVKRLGAVGIGSVVEKARKRIGFGIGILLFCIITAFSSDYVFGVEFTASDVYAREAYIAMEECGISLGKRYNAKNADLFCAKMLALDGVEFCSIKKDGLKLCVDVRMSPVKTEYFQKGAMRAKHTGTLTALTVLRGSPLKKIGEEVTVGEALVGDWFSTEDGGQVRVELIARARIACTYEEKIDAENEEEAFAKAYLYAGLERVETIYEKRIEKTDDGYLVALCYDVVESMNF